MERINVTVRARPLSQEDSKTSPWKISGNSIFLANNSSKFDFDRIFGQHCKTVDVYESRTKEIVASAVQGFNGTVFAYGQTNSGKTHTMRGSIAEPGIIPLSVHDLFKSIEEDVDREFLVRMSYMEIYNEEINDLLAPEHRKLQIHENVERGIYVAGLREEIVTSPEQVLDTMEFGESHRHIGETNMNLYSSRSHTIFRMIVESREKIDDDNMDKSCDAVRVSVLNLVDLAGSERAAKTGAEGMRLKEGSHINKSLMTLGTVIKKLSEGIESQGGHVPYRDSKLTRILQPALGGNSNTAMICNITLAQVHTDETKSSLQFASRALRVTNCACVNEILTDAALLRRQRNEIEELRAKLLSSNSDHWGEEILNLRNTLLQSELEKERIALELDEEKKAKAHRERRLLEQAKKIANLSSLVLCSERDEKTTYPSKSKNRRRDTWCPGLLQQKTMEVLTHQATTSREQRRSGRDMGLPPPFKELVQENDVTIDIIHSQSCLPDIVEKKDHLDNFSTPDARDLFHVTNRRKVHLKGARSLLNKSQEIEQHQGLTNMLENLECTPMSAVTRSSVGHLSGSASHGCKSLTTRESEAILVIKQLQDKIKSLEMEKVFMEKNLDNVVELATEQNIYFREKYEEDAELDSFIKLSIEVQGVALEVDGSRKVVDDALSVVDDLFHNFSILSKILLEFKTFVSHDMVQLKSIIDGHKKIDCWMRSNVDELELEKKLLNNQSVNHQKRIQDMQSEVENLEKTMGERDHLHDMERDGLLSEILNLQKESSSLSSSFLAREKESLRKELDKTKSKLKDAESKLKNTIQDKIKLESERAHTEREIKQLHGQRAVLERDIWKRDSVIDKRRESKPDYNKEDYEQLEFYALEMESEIASLNESLLNANGEKEQAFVRIQIIDSELENMTNKINVADSEARMLKEDLSVTKQRLEEYESFSKKMEVSLGFLSREKEEMAMQLTDALLEAEAEKSTWLVKEKAIIESKEREKISNDECIKLSKELLEVRHELEACREEVDVLRERLVLSEELTEKEKECSTSKSMEITRLMNELKQYTVGMDKYADVKSEFEVLLSEHHHACEEVKKLKEHLSILTQEKNKLSVQVKEMDKGSDMSNTCQEALRCHKEEAKLRMRLRSTQAKLDAFRGRYREAMDEIGQMNKNFEEASAKLKKQLASYGVEILRLKKELSSKD